jgi:hypothetical protein
MADFKAGQLYETREGYTLAVTYVDADRVTFRYLKEAGERLRAMGESDVDVVSKVAAQKTAEQQGWKFVGMTRVQWEKAE